MKVLITGGAGYIGSTIASALRDSGVAVVLVDDLSTGTERFLEGRVAFVGDIADAGFLDRVLNAHPDVSHVIHCAAKIVVPESVADPIGYYDANVAKGIAFLRCLQRHGVQRMIFSSSAAMYAPTDDFTVDERSRMAPTNPYAASKMLFERILEDVCNAGIMRAVSLRYFNPIGADPELRTGQASSTPSHALGRLISAAKNRRPFFITGTDWPTRDGTGIRDYIHVWDLAEAHVRAVEQFDGVTTQGHHYRVINLGTGSGTTVNELVGAYRRVAGHDAVAVRAAPRRAGDTAGAYTRSQLAEQLLGWTAERTLEEGVRDSIRWADVTAKL